MRWLKSLVIVLAGLILLALAALGYGFYKRSVDPDWRLFGSAPPAEAKPSLGPAETPPPVPVDANRKRVPLEPWGEVNLNLPTGCKVTAMQAQRGLLYFTIGPSSTATACDRVIVFDARHGRVLGTVRTGP